MTYIPSVISKIDTQNSSSSTLSANATFGSSSNSMNNAGYNSINISILTDTNSAPNGLVVYYSNDNTTWEIFFSDTYTNNTKYSISLQLTMNYYYITYTNGSSNQSSFNLVVYMSPTKNSSNYVNFDLEHTDTYDRLQVVEPVTLLDMRFYNNGISTNPLMIVQDVSGSCSGALTSGTTNYVISSTGTGYLKSQSYKYCVYQPGKSQLIYITGILNNGNNGSNVTTKIGYFDDNDGLYFSYNNGTTYVNIINNGSLTSISNANWNGDKLNGTGTSGYTIDYTKNTLFAIQFSWLGAGIIRFMVLLEGHTLMCHTITNYNTLTGAWMTNPNLPIRYELSSTSAGANGTGSMVQGCASCISIGGYNPIGRIFSISNGIAGASISTTEVLVLAIKGNSNYYHQQIIPMTINATSSTTSATVLLKLRLYLSPNVPNSGGSITWTDVNTSQSLVSYATSITGGTFTGTNSIISQEIFVYGRTGMTNINDIGNIFTQIASNITNQSSILVISAVSSTNNTTLNIGITWQEVY